MAESELDSVFENPSPNSIENLPLELQETILSFLLHSEVYQVIQCSRNMYQVAMNLYRNKFFNKEFHIMKLKKRKEGLHKLKEEYINKKFNFLKEYGEVRTRMVKTVPANIKLDPIVGEKVLEEVKVTHCESLDHRAVFSAHAGGFSNAVQCFNGEVIVTNDHEFDFGFYDVIKEGTNPIPNGTCVIQIAFGSNDIVYISPLDKNESCGEVYSIKKLLNNSLDEPVLIDLPEKAKYVCGSVIHQFAVTIDNKVYAWLPHEEDFKPFEIKGLFNDENEYDEDGKVIENEEENKEGDSEEKILKQLKKKVEDEEHLKNKEKESLENKNKNILKICSGNHFLLILYKSGELFSCSFNEERKLNIIARRIPDFIGKNIMDIEAGFTHWIAFEKY